MCKKFLPESMYEIDSKITRDSLCIGKTITGQVALLKPKSLIVKLGNGLEASMSIDNASIYPIFKSDGSFSANISTLVGKTICAKVCNLNNGIMLSRKANMLDAIDFLEEQTEFYNVPIKSFSKASAFVDVGAGIIGVISPIEFCNTRFRNIRDIGIKEKALIPAVKNLGFNKKLKTFDLSRKQILPKAEDMLSKNDIVSCKVFDELGDGLGYYVLIDQSVCGLLDSKIKLSYGDNILGIVKNISPKGPRLDFVSF